jgi:hypothetical protein
MYPKELVKTPSELPPAIPAHNLGIGNRIEVRFAENPTNKGMLREEIL